MFGASIGLVPAPAFIAIFAALLIDAYTKSLPRDLTTVIAVLSVSGFLLAELGSRIPLLRMLGGPVLLAGFVPSYLVYHKLIPEPLLAPIAAFWKNDNPLSLFVLAVVVGSILSMNRQQLIKGFAKIFVPLLFGSIAAMFAALAVGSALGLSVHEIIFFIAVPIMAGGLGEGAIPLSIGYALLMHTTQGEVLARVIPVIMLANLCAIICCGLLNAYTKKRPHLTGNGRIDASSADEPATSTKIETDTFDIRSLCYAGYTGIALYFVGMVIQRWTDFPGAVAMLLLALALKLTNGVSGTLHTGAHQLHRFFARVTTFPLLFGIGAFWTPWDKLMAAITLANIATIVATVITLIVVGFVCGRRLGMYPVEAAIINACHSGLGGGGDVAILTAANRMTLMPFAQIATRVGGMGTILCALAFLRFCT
ncbi:2-hydroxycarboxylate transporter family protein [Paraburkholderia agricolaris]|uniref:2-hydroxycarboxylate transporter family protein n=1 Tax=Paraburkholderia agricolaris TaxID=2152888 RepID=UPI0012919986|nr:2-hydroxycarboxylate transporter family protein [Paraburkholderia agricolaris]